MNEDENEVQINKDDVFMNNLNSTLAVKRDYELNEFNYEWLDIVEETIPYLDNIVRNPKRFIVNEEEVVKVELSKKITVESVIHLTQHTNLIQDYNEEKGDVKPSKVLNINKEESLDTYENRFIFTLINNLRTFFEERTTNTGESFYIDKKNVSYEGNTKVGTEDVKVSVKLTSYDKDVRDRTGKYSGPSINERVRKIKVQLDGFVGSELMVTLNMLHVPPVRSPIRKTNVILKNPNFRKAEELWNYIQTFVSKDKKEKEKKDYFDNGALKNRYNEVFLMNYIANQFIGDAGSKTLSEKKLITDMLDKLIENIMDTDPNVSEDKLKDIFNKQIEAVKARNTEKALSISKIILDRFEREKKKMNDVLNILGCVE